MKLLIALALVPLMLLSPAPAAETVRERLSLDAQWRFHLGDIPFPEVKGHGPSYNNAKAGRAGGAAAPDYDDTGWRLLDLPHDWASEAPFDPNANVSQGYRPRGFGWYRRNFKLDPADRGKHLELQFDGVSTHCTVWVNGSVVHRNWCGYTSFYIDLTPFARYGDEINTIAVRVDAEAQEGWWYEGAGIYRHTWLVKRSPVHIVTDGVYAQPVRGADGRWTLNAEATLGNSGRAPARADVEFALVGPDGKTVGSAKASADVPHLTEAVAKASFPVDNPRLWSVDEPVLYTVRTTLKSDGVEKDAVTTPCGFRTIRFDPDNGFFLNDRPLKFQGVCNHQDHAGVGVAVPASLWEFRLRKLKEMGVNAYRCAHNPPAAEFLAACDRIGMLVMDENRNFNSSPEYMRQLEWLIRRDRNHPSVILWSVFNEEPQQGTEVGAEMVRRMVATVRRLDPTRPVTAAMNGGLFAPINVSQEVDVVGFNYQQTQYDRFRKENPKMCLTSSEDTSAFMTRGEFATDKKRHIMGSYDTERAPWGATHRNAWKAIATRPFLGGAFVWTGFDYHGEPTPHTWPTAASFFGILDLCGFPKTAFYLHQAQWVKDKPVLHLVPHWNWPGSEGQPIKVMALSNAERVEVLVNGKSAGEKPVDPFEMAEWQIPYAPGTLEAVGRSGGKEVSRFKVETTEAAVALNLEPDRTRLDGDGLDAIPITVSALDAKGRPVPAANLPVEFELNGPGQIIGLGNGDPNSHEPEKGNRRSPFNGLAQVIVQTRAGGTGPLVLTAKSGTLRPAKVSLEVRAIPAPPAVAAVRPTLALEKWRLSPGSPTRPDPSQAVADNDMNSWVPVQPGKLQKFDGGTWAIYRIKFSPFASEKAAGGAIAFKAVTGKAEAWIDGKQAGTKTSAESAPWTVPLPPGAGERTLSVLIETQPGQPAGFGGGVSVGPADPQP